MCKYKPKYRKRLKDYAGGCCSWQQSSHRHLITNKTVAPIVNLLGRTHWKIENENNNLGHARPRQLAAVNASDTTLPQLPDELFSEMLSHLLGESAPCRKAATLAATLAWRLKMADPATSTVAPTATT